MTAYLMVGKYSSESIKEISSNRTDQAIRLIRECGGKVKLMYAVLGGFDLLMIVEFPKLEAAMRASVGLNMLTGISFNTFPAISVDDFDKLIIK